MSQWKCNLADDYPETHFGFCFCGCAFFSLYFGFNLRVFKGSLEN